MIEKAKAITFLINIIRIILQVIAIMDFFTRHVLTEI